MLQKEASALNGMVISLRDRVARLTVHQRSAQESMAGARRALGTGVGQESHARLTEVEASLIELGRQLDQFQVDTPRSRS